MSTEIYYFSGTGNSLYVARELQKRITDSIIIPMVSLLNKKVIRTQGKTVGFVFPVHALTIPIAVKRFIKKTDMESSEYIFAIASRIRNRGRYSVPLCPTLKSFIYRAFRPPSGIPF